MWDNSSRVNEQLRKACEISLSKEETTELLALMNGSPCRFKELLEGCDFCGLFSRNPMAAMYVL